MYREFWDGQNPDVIGDCTNYHCNLLTAVCSLHLTNLEGEKNIYIIKLRLYISLTILAMDIGGRLILLI